MTTNLRDAIVRAYADRLESLDADSPAATAILSEISTAMMLQTVLAEVDRRRVGWLTGLPQEMRGALPIA